MMFKFSRASLFIIDYIYIYIFLIYLWRTMDQSNERGEERLQHGMRVTINPVSSVVRSFIYRSIVFREPVTAILLYSTVI